VYGVTPASQSCEPQCGNTAGARIQAELGMQPDSFLLSLHVLSKKYLLGLTVLKHANVLPFVQRPLLQMLLLQTHPKDCILFVAPLKALVSLSSLEAELTCKCDRFLLFSLILVSLLSKWNAVVQDLQAAMEQVFHKHTVEEWMEENVYPSLEKLQQVVDDLDKAIKAQN